MEPLISVVMPVRDGAAFLEQAVRSILGQSLRELELIAVDDGSTDGTAALLAGFAAGDGRVRVLGGAARGLVGCLNRGVDAARGRYVARMDADDVAHAGRLARQVAVLEGDERVAVVGSAWRVIDPAGALLRVVRPPAGAAADRKSVV